MGLIQPVEKPWFEVTVVYGAKSEDITNKVTSLTYTDYEHGFSDCLELMVEDSKHLFKEEWLPTIAVQLQIEAKIGYTDGRRLDCGLFEIDELEFSCDHDGGDTVRVKALTTLISPALRTARTFGYEGMTLRDIVFAVAERNKLKVRERDEIEKIPIDYTAQNHITDLQWLVQLADDFNYVCGVRGEWLDFWRVAYLEQEDERFEILRGKDLIKGWRRLVKSEAIAPDAMVQYQNYDAKALVIGTAEEKDKPTGDVHKYLKRAPDTGMADRKAASNLHRLDKLVINGGYLFPGDVRMEAGINIRFLGDKKLDGKYHVTTAVHRLSRDGGYETEIVIYYLTADYKKLGFVIEEVSASGGSSSSSGIPGIDMTPQV